MVTLKTEHGEFTAETVRKAERAAKVAERKAREQAEIDSVKRGRARIEAQAIAWRLAHPHIDDTAHKPDWVFVCRSDSYSGVLYKHDVIDGGCELSIDGAECGVYGQTFVGCIQSPCGTVRVIVTREGISGNKSAWAVGLHEGQAALESIPFVLVAHIVPQN